MEIKLSGIVIDENIIVRKTDNYAVSRYAEALRVGEIFPPLIIDQKKRLVCGHTRYHALKRVFGEDSKVDVVKKTFKNDIEAIKEAASDNSKHGIPLDSMDKKNITLRLIEAGESKDVISKILCISIEKIEIYSSLCVIVTEGGKKTKKPLKRGFEHLSGKTVSSQDYEDHKKRDLGMSSLFHAQRLIAAFEKEWINTEDAKTMTVLKQLYSTMKLIFEK